MFYTVKMPFFIKKLFPSLVYSIPGSQKNVYITFDDGPIPGTTPLILEILNSFDAKATFFCLGKNVKQNPGLFDEIKKAGHAIGNHSYNHLNGWNTKTKTYYIDIENAGKIINSKLFRPPYGKITPRQIKYLKQKYKIVMWDVLSGDFDNSISANNCIDNVLSNTKSGSIIVFHDSLKAKDLVLKSLPVILKELTKQGFRFLPIT